MAEFSERPAWAGPILDCPDCPDCGQSTVPTVIGTGWALRHPDPHSGQTCSGSRTAVTAVDRPGCVGGA